MEEIFFRDVKFNLAELTSGAAEAREEECFYLFRLRLSRSRKKSVCLGPPIALLL